MRNSKKLLSLVLCLAMLISTMAVGFSLSASADSGVVKELTSSTIPTYESLDGKYGSNPWVYFGALYKDADGKVLSKEESNTVEEGDEITVEVYYMTNCNAYDATNIAIAFDKDFFDTSSSVNSIKAGTAANAAINTSTSGIKKKQIVDTDKNNKTFSLLSKDNDGNVFVPSYAASTKVDEKGVPQDGKYTLDQVKNWSVVTFALKANGGRIKTYSNMLGTSSNGSDNKGNLALNSSTMPVATFTVTVKKSTDDDTNAGNGKATLPSYYYTSLYADGKSGVFYDTINTAVNQTLVTSIANTKKGVKAETFINDCNCSFKLAGVDVTFMDGDVTVGTYAAGAGVNIGKANAPTVENLFAWADKDGNIVDLDNTAVTSATTYYAVKNDKKINVTLNLGKYSLDSANSDLTSLGATYNASSNTITLTSQIGTQLDLTKISVTGDDFSGWYNEASGDFTGTFKSTAENQTFSARSGIPIMYLDIAKAPDKIFEASCSKYSKYGEWETLGYYNGASYGKGLTANDLIAIQNMVNDKYDTLNANTHAADYGVDIEFCETYSDTGNITTSERLSKETAQYGAFRINSPAGDDLSSSNIGTYTVGNISAIYLNTAVNYNYEIYLPHFDSDENVIKEGDKVSYGDPTYSYTVTYPAMGLRSDDKTVAEQYCAYNEGLYYSINNTGIDTDIDNTNNNIARFIVGNQDKPINVEYNEYKYRLTYKNNEGKEESLSISNKTIGKKITYYLCFKRLANADGSGVDKNCSTYRCYVEPVDILYHVGIRLSEDTSSAEAAEKSYASDKAYKYGDTITKDAFTEVYTRASVVSIYKDNDRTDYDSKKFNISDLQSDGSKVGQTGKTLYSIQCTYGGKTVDFIDDANPEVTLDEKLIEAYKANNGLTDYNNTFIAFTTKWMGSDFKFNVYYQNASSEWVYLTAKVYTNGDTVTYADMIGSGSELDSQVKADHPFGYAPTANFSAEPGGTTLDKVSAEDASNDNNTMNLYIVYSIDTRYAMVDYNNAYDENGQLNENRTAGEVSNNLHYGDVIYDPSYTAESGTTAPFFNTYLLDEGFEVASTPSEKQKTDKDGNPVYEYKYVEVKDENGETVIDPKTGNPKTEIETDEKGNPVYDYSKPFMDDAKSNTVARPYRNCEFNGFKVYYVDGVYSKVEDLPDKSEWKEGFNDQNETGAQHLYTTTIIQAQWIADSSFRLRVYDDQGNISFALGKDWSRHYWNVKGYPCNKGENDLIVDRKAYFCAMFRLVKEEGYGYYLQAVGLPRVYLNNTETSGLLIGTLLPLIKNLLK